LEKDEKLIEEEYIMKKFENKKIINIIGVC
jgi:hypothetical protein